MFNFYVYHNGELKAEFLRTIWDFAPYNYVANAQPHPVEYALEHGWKITQVDYLTNQHYDYLTKKPYTPQD